MKKPSVPVIEDEFFKTPEFQEAIDAFAETRKEKRAPLTETALKLILKRLRRLSDNEVEKAIEILEQSVEFGYQGVFPLKDEQQSFTQEMTRKRTEI